MIDMMLEKFVTVFLEMVVGEVKKIYSFLKSPETHWSSRGCLNGGGGQNVSPKMVEFSCNGPIQHNILGSNFFD